VVECDEGYTLQYPKTNENTMAMNGYSGWDNKLPSMRSILISKIILY
jgi:hypothetical protein